MTSNLMNKWIEYPIKNIGTVVTGNTPPKKDPENYGGELVWIKPPDLDKKKFISKSEDTISDIGREKVRLLPKGSVLVSCIGNIGKIAIADCELCTNQQINSIIPNNNIVDSIFLYYAIKRMKPYLEKIASSAVVPLLNKSDFSKVKIKLPPLETQKKIADILEKAGKLKEWRIEADTLANEYLKSVFLDMFGDINSNDKNWEIKKISDLAEIKTGGTPSRKIKEYWENGDIPWVKTTEVNGSIIKNVQEFITKEGLSNSNANLFPKDTILVAMYGQGKTRGKCGKLGIKATTNQACAAILPSNKYNTDYLWYFLDVSYENLRELGRGGNQPNLNLSMIKNFEILNPPLELQNQFAKIALRVETLKTQQSQSKEEINNLFNTLIQKSFKGELVC